MSEEEEVVEKAQKFMDNLNRVLSIVTGLAITASMIYISTMTESPLHPTNNLQFGAFLAVMTLAGLYWLVTGIKPGLKISNLRE